MTSEAPLHERIAEGRRVLVGAGIRADGAMLDAEVLARHALGWDRAALLSRAREAPPEGFELRFSALIARRAAREPVAQIVGRREFWGLDFEVTSDVLTPRPESELIVEEALDATLGRRPAHIIDVGTGSGCLAIALAVSLPDTRLLGVDISCAALAVARRNAALHSVEDRVDFVCSHLLDGVSASADLIIANPPYVPESAAPALQPEVIRYEPEVALFSGADGLSAMRELFASAARCLAGDGLLVVEFGFGQEAGVRALAGEYGWQVMRLRADLQGIPRVAVLRR